MEERIANFIAALRASGVRVSVAESEDAWRAIRQMGIIDREAFRLSLRATLVKDSPSFPIFDELFAQYFEATPPPMLNPLAGLSPEQMEQLRQALEDMLQDLSADLQQLLEWLLDGDGPTPEEMQELVDQVGFDPRLTSPRHRQRAARRILERLDAEQLAEALEQLWERLAELGMPPEVIDDLKQQLAENMARLQAQLEQFMGEQAEEERVQQAQHRARPQDLMQRSFGALRPADMDVLRDEVRRLAARLRTRAALRQKRGKQGKLDPKGTIRASLRTYSVPFEIRFKHRRLKPRLVVFLDVSTSMRPVTEFFLRLLYELQDQVQKTRSFAFIDHLEDVTPDLAGLHIDAAVVAILTKLPPGYYNTDFGASLRQFQAGYLDTVDSRTTVIVLGDGRNNYNDPARDVFDLIGRRARKVIWMNPEDPARWGTGDSDMPVYAPLCSELYRVSNLAQLTQAIDRILM